MNEGQALWIALTASVTAIISGIIFALEILKQPDGNEKMMPKSFINKSGYSITSSCRKYLAPLIKGEAYPNYENGLPRFATLKNKLVPKRLKTKFMV